VQIEPRFAEAHNYLGMALLQACRVQEAIEHYRQALRIKPDYMEAQMNLDRALERGSSGKN
jgi:tetratricopeptide (TPR) repeat protein